MRHRGGISRRLGHAASGVLLSAACHGDASGPTATPRSALLAVARKDTVNPASPQAFPVKNNHLSGFSVTHTDPSGTVFAQFTFTPLSVLSACDTCTASITVTVIPGAYGVVLSGPSGLAFDAANRPTVMIAYGRYADRGVYDSTGRYASFAAFEQALRLWRRRAADDWVKASDVGPTVAATVTAPLDAPGTYLLAAPK